MSDFNLTSYNNIIEPILANIYLIIGLFASFFSIITGIIYTTPEVRTGPHEKRFFDYIKNQLVVESEYIVDWKYSIYIKIFQKKFHISRKKEVVLTKFHADSSFNIFLKPLTSFKEKLCRDYYDETTGGEIRSIIVRLNENTIKKKNLLHKHDEDHYFVDIFTYQKEMKQKILIQQEENREREEVLVYVTNNTSEIIRNCFFEMSEEMILKDLLIENRYIENVQPSQNKNSMYILKDIKPNEGRNKICLGFIKRHIIPS